MVPSPGFKKERLKSARNAKKLTMEQLAKLVNTTKGTISNYENGHSTPPNETLYLLAEALDVTTDHLLGRDFDLENKVIRNIIKLRKQQGISQEEFGKMIGLVDPDLWTTFEKEGNVPPRILRRAAEVLGTTDEYLLGLTDEQQSAIKTIVADQEIFLSLEELRVLEEIRKHPLMFHDLVKDPEKKVKDLIKLWKVKQDLMKEDDDDYFDEPIIED